MGIGYDFSKIRPKGTPTSNHAIASGVVSFMYVFDAQTKTITQGSRRGANMGVLNIYHSDIFDYINAKNYDADSLTQFNISVMVDDDFMKAVENDEEIYLHYPVYDEKGYIIKDESKWTHKKKIRAKELWDMIMEKAYNTGEPGVLFYNNMNRDNNTYYIETIVSTNPCGEYLSGVLHKIIVLDENGHENIKIDSTEFKGACNLGSLFLHNFVVNPFTKDAYIDFSKLEDTIYKAVRFLDNIIDVNKFPHQHYKNYQHNMRTIGLGITGLADMLVMLNIKYGSEESIILVDKLMNFIAKTAYFASIELAKEKGSFPFLNRKKFVQSGFIQKHLKKDPDWQKVIDGILKYGIRNARLLSVAPTGTLSLTFGNNCSSGLEPIFSLEYDRKVKIGGQSEENAQIVTVRDYAYELWKNTKENNIVKEDVFVTAMDLSVKEHLEVLKTVAFHVDMSVSKTINIPSDYSFEDTKEVYVYAWKNGIKGCTIFRPNALRQGILIDKSSKEENKEENITKELKRGEWKELAEDTKYYKRKVYIGCGKLNLFIGYSEKEKRIQDLYVVRSGQGGCERNLQAMVIAMSGMLRLGGNLFNIEKAFEGLGVCPSFVSQRVKGYSLSKGTSCGTAILNEIKKFLKEIQSDNTNNETKDKNDNKDKDKDSKIKVEEQQYFECPECGEKTLAFEGGCSICSNCGYSKCS